jgi:hypothetical protein
VRCQGANELKEASEEYHFRRQANNYLRAAVVRKLWKNPIGLPWLIAGQLR